MTTPNSPAGQYPNGDPVSMTQVIGEPYETTDASGDPVGIAEHIVAVTGVVDEVGDVFVPGVFADVIRRGATPKGVSGHDWGVKVSRALDREEWLPGDPRIAERIVPALPAGKSWPSEAGAVYVKAQYNLRTPEGRRAYENAKFFGPEESFSVGYKTADGGARKRGGRRYINKLEGWYEWSDVLHGANKLAFGLSVKAGLLDSELEYSGGRLVGGATPHEGKPARVEEKMRVVRDSAYWGLPLGTPIRPGMKPRGPKANKLRKANQPTPDTMGAATVPDDVQQVKPVAKGKRKSKGRELIWKLEDQIIEAFDEAHDDISYLDETVDEHQINKGGEYNPLDILLDNAVRPADLEEELRTSDWDRSRLGDADYDRDKIEAYIDEVVAQYRQKYRARLAEQHDTGDGIVPEPDDLDDAVPDDTPATGAGEAEQDVPSDGEDAAPTVAPDTDAVDSSPDRTYSPEQIEAIGGRRWQARGGTARYYLNDVLDLAGYDPEFYKSGNLYSARPRGDQPVLSNRKANMLRAGKVWLDSDGTIKLSGIDGEHEDEIRAEIARRVAGQAPDPAGTEPDDEPTDDELTAMPAGSWDGPQQPTSKPSGRTIPRPPEETDPVAAELEQLVDDPGVRAVLATVLAEDVGTARQLGRDLARSDSRQASLAHAEAGSVADFAGRDKRGYPLVAAGADRLQAFASGVMEATGGASTRDTDGDTSAEDVSADDALDDALDDQTSPDEVISADDLADGDLIGADALGLIEADDGELEVTAEVADRQDRVEALLEGGEQAVTALDDTQLPDARRDVADEIALQDEIARRDRERRRKRAAEPTEGPGPDTAETAAEDAAEGDVATGEETQPEPASEPAEEKPKVRAGLAGAAEDYADALDAGDQTAIEAARARLASSLRRSRSESEHAQALRDLLASDTPPDPATLRELAGAMRDEARERRNAQARTRRLAKRLERERLRSLLGQIDAEMRTRGLSTSGDAAGPAGERDTEPDAVISAEDLAAGQAVADQPPAEAPAAAPAEAGVTEGPGDGAQLGVWSDLGRLPTTVRGLNYEATIDTDPHQPDQYSYEYRITEPGGRVPVNVGSGKEGSVDDARRAVIDGLTEGFDEAPDYGGVPEGERLPDAPGEDTTTDLPASNIGGGVGDTPDADVLSAEDLAEGEQVQEGAESGQDRGARGEPLAEVPAEGLRDDQGPGDVLSGPGGSGRGGDRDAGGVADPGTAAGGDDSAAGGLAGDGTPGRGIPGAGGDGAQASGGRDEPGGRGRPGVPGGPGTEGGADRLRGGQGGAGAPPGADQASDRPAGRDGDAGLTDPGVTEKDQPAPDVAAVNRVPTTGEAFTPTGTESFAPSGTRAKLNANMDALRTLRVLQSEDPPRPATAQEQQILARWAGWGGLPKVFDDTVPDYADEREELRALLSPQEWNAAKRNTLNAHYTDSRAVTQIWQAVQDLGVTQGRVLEPGSGSGNFIGLAPQGMDMIGVELDPTTAAMSKYLYPDAEIRNESFARSRFPEGAFDAAVGNVPFGDFTLTDREGNRGRHSIHNHFIIKSLKATRPGGIVAMLTSRYTMDSQDSKAREEMAEYGDLLGAVRLPTGSHRAASGTDVIEDVLIFRRREDGAEPATDQGWVTADKQTIPTGDGTGGYDLPVNSYWAQHPDHVLGTMRTEKGRFGSGEIVVDAQGRPDEALTDQLAGALRSITSEATANGLAATPREGPLPELVDTTSAGSGGRYEGNIAADTSSGDPKTYKFTQVAGGEAIDITDDIPASTRAEFAALLELRATFGALLDAESSTSTDTPRIVALRAELNDRYDRYTSTYGAITRYKYTKTGARQRPAAARLLRRDPKSAGIRALESNFDPAGDGGKGSWTRASIFTKRSAAPREIASTADNPADALALSLETHGRIDLPAIGEMLGLLEPQPAGVPNGMQDTSAVRAALGDLVFDAPDVTPEQEDLLVRLERARALGVEPSAADTQAALDFNDQQAGEVTAVTAGPPLVAAEYLSGDVRRKLAVARQMARHDSRYQANVAALEQVVPADLGPSEIDARLGASWIPPEVIAEFVRDLHGIDAQDRYSQVQVSKAGSIWNVIGPKHGNAAIEEWGTDRRTASELVQAMLEQRSIRITTKDEDGKSVYDLNATLAAQAKVEALAERFAEWAWEDPQRARTLADNYNWQFNNIALRSYDGARRTFPGMAAEFTPRPHQVAAVERIVNEPTALLAHVVGAGKTAEMVMGTAELKRLGLARKPAIVVPNHMLEQFTREYLEIYPNANVLAAGSDDLVGEKRKEFVARAAASDVDAVILTQKAFEAIPMSPEQQEAYIQRELADMRDALESAQAAAQVVEDEATKRTVKQMEKAILRAEEALRKKFDKDKDSAVSFEQTGIDYLMVDEAHHYSNLRTLSNIPGAGATGSNMASDLHMKMEYLRERNQSGRVATFATGTPVRNTVTQTYIMIRYLRPDLLRAAGITSFDAWAATFGQVVEEMELKPEGSGFRQSARFAKFQNVPELLRMMHVFADVKMREDLDLPTPNLVGGQTETVTVATSDARQLFIAELGERAEKVRSGGVEPDVDNMLKISGDGRKAALSMRLVGRDDEEPGKIEAAADRISSIYADTKDRVYPVDPGNPEAGDDPNAGALQIVFCDLGTPKTGKAKGKASSMDDSDSDWNAYDELRDQLAERGVPKERVAFIHDAKNDAEKAEMFARARSGQISVLIGSTEKMGVGTNVQKRAVALHHLDAPWRPSDVEQRDGRILRQGNLNEDVQVIRYVTEGSFDAYMWQTLERKAKFINQVMRGSLDVREIEDVGDAALSYGEVKALATGNPDLMAIAKVDTLKGKLERLLRTHTRSQTNNANMVGILGVGADQADANAELLDAAAQKRVDTRAGAFRIEFANLYRAGEYFPPVTKREAATDRVREMLATYARQGDSSYYRSPEPMVVGRIGGHNLVAAYERKTSGGVVTLRFDGVPGDITQIPSRDAGKVNPLPRIERALEGFEARAAAERDRAEAQREEAAKVAQRVGLEFPRMPDLEAARAKSARLREKMQRDALRDHYRAQGVDWDDPATSARLDPAVLERLRFDPRIDSDEFDSPLLERDTVTDPQAGQFDSAAAKVRLRAALAASDTQTAPTTPATDAPAGDKPYDTVAELREHLESIAAIGYAPGSDRIDWSTALISPQGGLFLFKSGTDRRAVWKIAHTGSGAVVAQGLPGGRRGAMPVMGALEKVVAPNGAPIDWTIRDVPALQQALKDAGYTSMSALLDAAKELAAAGRGAAAAA